MARSTSPPRMALCAIAATVAAVALALAAGPASARPYPLGDRHMAQCQASDLSINVPTAIKGDPARGMGKQDWNLLFRNTSNTACSLGGWPRIAVHTTKGKTVATSVTDALSSNLAVVPDTPIGLRPGQTAVVSAITPVSKARCVTRWTLALTLPGADRPVTVGAPAGSLVPCVGGRLQLSPFYAKQTLTRDIAALSVSKVPPPFTVSTAAEPPTCPASALRAQVTCRHAGPGVLAPARLAPASLVRRGASTAIDTDPPCRRVSAVLCFVPRS